MSLSRQFTMATAVSGAMLLSSLTAVSQAAEPLEVRPAVLHSASPSGSTAIATTPVHFRHYGYAGGYSRAYAGGYYGGYRGYYGGYRGYYGGGGLYGGPAAYGVGYGYRPYGYGFYRPWYTYPQAYYRYGYYAYPSYYTFAYPYSYGGTGLYMSGYYGGIYNPGIAGVAVVAPAPVAVMPYSYGAFYSYPGYNCCW